jgi:hypothetical protein
MFALVTPEGVEQYPIWEQWENILNTKGLARPRDLAPTKKAKILLTVDC